ncbi:MAG: zf-HC2 domain-containing protein, partial [Anaerolineae bacterium]|nr:zf-HC2 domain-containing protein [Anaerolineae bacterium]
MNCTEIRELLPLYADGDLEGAEHQAVAEHLETCLDCARRLEADRELTVALAELAAPAGIGAMERSVRDRVMAEVQKEQRWRPLWQAAERLGNVTVWATVSAVVALLVLALAISWRPMMQRLGRVAPAAPAPQPTEAPTAPEFGPARDLLEMPPSVGLKQWAISPDGRWVAYAVLKEGAGEGPYPRQAVATNLESGETITLLPDLAADAQVSWFPDSRRVLVVVPPGGGQMPRLLVKGLDDTPASVLVASDTEVYGIGEATASPDGRLVAFTCLHPDNPAPVPKIGIEVVASDGSERRQIVEPDHFIGQLAWTPDGEEIAYFKGKGGTPPDDGDAYVVAVEGGEPRLLLPRQRVAGWSPDGRRALWLGEPADSNGRADLRLSDWPLAGEPRLLAEGVDSGGVAWTGNSWITYGREGVLFLDGVDGESAPRRLSAEGEWAGAPVWLPDKGLAYLAQRANQGGVLLRLLPLGGTVVVPEEPVEPEANLTVE